MTRAYDERLQMRRAQLFSAGQLLGAMSYRGVLSRGFALVRDETQRPLWRADEVRQAQRLEIEFADGKIGADCGRPRRAAHDAAGAAAPQTREIRQGRGGAGVVVLNGFDALYYILIMLFAPNPIQGNPRRTKEKSLDSLAFLWPIRGFSKGYGKSK